MYRYIKQELYYYPNFDILVNKRMSELRYREPEHFISDESKCTVIVPVSMCLFSLLEGI